MRSWVLDRGYGGVDFREFHTTTKFVNKTPAQGRDSGAWSGRVCNRSVMGGNTRPHVCVHLQANRLWSVYNPFSVFC